MFSLSFRLIYSGRTLFKYSCIRFVHKQQFIDSKYLKDANILLNLQPTIMKLDTPNLRKVITPELIQLFDLFKSHGYEIRIAGGAVRDLLNGSSPKDLDFATTATPAQMKNLFTKENIRMFNTNGEKHGTISSRINEENFEITTLRIDVKTDGRHAQVEFTTEWVLDASRRDLTVNSMYLDLDGTVYDYFNGYEDLKNRKIRFVGDPALRIQEDYLRILRYFRFYGRIAEHPDKHEESVLEAIRENRDGLKQISGERIWSELSKILTGNFGGELTMKMIDINLGPYMGLPENANILAFKETYERCKGINLKPTALLSSLFSDVQDVFVCNSRLKWSVFERDLAYFITDFKNYLRKGNADPLKQCFIFVIEYYKNPNINEYVKELIKYHADTELLEKFESLPVPSFPITPQMLTLRNVPRSKTFGKVYNMLKDEWIRSDFKLTEEELLRMLPDVLENSSNYEKTKISEFPKYKFKK